MRTSRPRYSFKALQDAGLWSFCVLAAAFAADTAVLMEALEGTLSLSSAILLHLAVLCTAVLAMSRVMPDDQTLPVLSLSFAVFSGPVGMIAGMALVVGAWFSGSGARLLERWTDWSSRGATFDSSMLLAESIDNGRALRASQPVRRLFPDVMARGSFDEKQWLLGIVAQKYHADYGPALDAALSDAEPGLRVQAAAVRARLNDRIKAEYKDILRTAGGTIPQVPAATALAARTIHCLKSNLLDPSEARRLREAVLQHCQRAAELHEHSSRLEEQIRWLLWSGGQYEAALDWNPGDVRSRPLN